jgi:hypothetical protein
MTTIEESQRLVAEHRAERAPFIAHYAETAFGDHASSCGVPLEVIMAAAARTFDMLDVDQQVELVEEELERWAAAKKNDDAVHRAQAVPDGEPSLVPRPAGLTTIYSQERDQMRNDLIYRLMHERFDLIYAIAVRRDDAPGGSKHHQWLITPPRADEVETPLTRQHVLLTSLMTDLRHIKQKVETIVKGVSMEMRRKK